MLDDPRRRYTPQADEGADAHGRAAGWTVTAIRVRSGRDGEASSSSRRCATGCLPRGLAALPRCPKCARVLRRVAPADGRGREPSRRRRGTDGRVCPLDDGADRGRRRAFCKALRHSGVTRGRREALEPGRPLTPSLRGVGHVGHVRPYGPCYRDAAGAGPGASWEVLGGRSPKGGGPEPVAGQARSGRWPR